MNRSKKKASGSSKASFTIVIFLCLLIVVSGSTIYARESEKPVIDIYYFYDNPCAACPTVSDFQVKIDQAGESLWQNAAYRVIPWQTYTTAGRSELERIMDAFELSGQDRLQSEYALIGDTLLIGSSMIDLQLEAALADEAIRLLAQRETIDEQDQSESDQDTQTPETRMMYQLIPSDEAWLYYFYITPCPSCDRAAEVLDQVESAYGSGQTGDGDKITINLEKENISAPEALLKAQGFFEAYNVPVNQQVVPIIFIGDRYLSGAEAIEKELVNLIDQGQGQAEIKLIPADSAADDVLYFLFSEYCETCKEAEGLLETIEQQKEIDIVRYDINHDQEQFQSILEMYNIEQATVPIIIYQGRVWKGYNPVIIREISEILEIDMNDKSSDFFNWNIDQLPLLFATIVIGLIDGFNPCSLWALLFLISMIMRFKSRKLILLLGLTFILVVSIVYGLFIIGVFGAVTYILDYLAFRILLFSMALLFALANIYSFFTDKDMLVSISSKNKKMFVHNIRSKLYSQNHLPGLIIATVLIALLASVIELPCTAGFPVIWNSMMAEQSSGWVAYASLLSLYLLMYVLVELIIVLFMVVSLSKMNMNMVYGRSLKLISGALMAYLAILLLLGNAFINNSTYVIGGSVAVILLSVVLAYLFRKK